MTAALSLNSYKRLSSGNKIPLLGFGVAYGFGKQEDPAELTKPSLTEALKAGYRHVDTAQMYGNERFVGECVKESGIDRGEIFITSKVQDHDAGYETTLKAIDDSLSALGFSYLDLYLIHRPADGTQLRLEQYKALIDAKKAGKLRDIGVSNYNIHHLEEITAAGLEQPAVDQIELHPFCQQRPIVEYCNKHGILVEAYCSVVRGAMDHPVIIDLAKKHGKDTAQILLRWSLQTSHIPLVRSSNTARIYSNADLYNFELDAEDMGQLDALDKGAEGAVSWNPIFVK